MSEDNKKRYLATAMRLKHNELQKNDLSNYEYFERMAEEMLEVLDEYDDSARYW